MISLHTRQKVIIMSDKNFFIMLADLPLAGSSVKTLKKPDVMVNDGVFLHDVKEKYEMLLTVDKKAEDPGEYSPCDIHGPSRTLMFSKQFIEILAALGVDNIQYLDADVTYEPTGEKVLYKVANVVGILSGLDLEQSNIILSTQGNVLSINTMRFDESKLDGHKIFRLQEDIMLLVVHRSIKEAVENAGLTGFMFLTDDEYEPGMI